MSCLSRSLGLDLKVAAILAEPSILAPPCGCNKYIQPLDLNIDSDGFAALHSPPMVPLEGRGPARRIQQ
jgi:hypothetical protein